MSLKNVIKKILLVSKNEPLTTLNILKRWNIRFGKYIWKKKYTTNELIDLLKKTGLKKGDTVFIQAAWDSFYNYLGNENELIDGILEVIGNTGTLMMPAYPLLRRNKIFDVRRSVTAAGMLAETFRNYPNVLRSANVRHSACAVGPNAQYLVGEHHKSLICFDEYSPFYKLKDVNAKIFILGLPHYSLGTIIHTIEATLYKNEPYFSKFYTNQKVVNRYKDIDGEMKSYESLCENSKINIRSDHFLTRYIIRKYFDRNNYKMAKLSNLNISSYNAQYVYNRLVELAHEGVVLYYSPRYSKNDK